MNSEVKYPRIRDRLVWAIRHLADPSYQERFWRQGETKGEEFIYGFDTAVHAIYDDVDLSDGAQAAIGNFFVDAAEAHAVDGLIAAMDALFAEFGTEASVATMMGSETWERMVSLAKVALPLLAGESESIQDIAES